MSDIDVGVQVLDYSYQINHVIGQLQVASERAHAAAAWFASEDGFYRGRARGEMKQFYDNYAAVIDKLVFFESLAAQYLVKVFTAFDEADRALAVMAWMDGG